MDTIEEIKKQITDKFMADENVQNLYSTTADDKFNDKFPTTSIESLLFYIIAYIVWLREKAHELWQSDVEATALSTRYGTKQWWHKTALAYQYGDEIQVADDATLAYATIDTTKQIIEYCAVVNEGRSVYLKVAKANGEDLAKLTDDELIAFQSYLDDVKPLGIRAIGQSLNACFLTIFGNIYYDAEKDKTEVLTAVQTAIKTYLNGIEFGGIIFTNKMIDAIQAVDGVTDVLLSITAADNGSIVNIKRAYQAQGGYYQVGGYSLTMNVETNIN